MAKRGEHFSSEFKFKVVLETLRKESTLAEIASKYDVTSKSVTVWKREFIENRVTVFNKRRLHSTLDYLTPDEFYYQNLSKSKVEIDILHQEQVSI